MVEVITDNDPKHAKRLEGKRIQPHRCNDRLEDLCRVMSGGWDQLSDNLRPAWDLAWQCYNSRPGEEPREPYFHLKAGDRHFKDHAQQQQRQQQ